MIKENKLKEAKKQPIMKLPILPYEQKAACDEIKKRINEQFLDNSAYGFIKTSLFQKAFRL